MCCKCLKMQSERPWLKMIFNLSSSYKSTHLISSSLLLYIFLLLPSSPESGLPLRRLRWEKGQWVGDCSDYHLTSQIWLVFWFFLVLSDGGNWPDLDKNLSHSNYSFFFSLIILTYIVDAIFSSSYHFLSISWMIKFSSKKKLLIAVWHLLGYTIIYFTWLLNCWAFIWCSICFLLNSSPFE